MEMAEGAVGDGDEFEAEVAGGLPEGEDIFAEVGEDDALDAEASGGAVHAGADFVEFEDLFEGGGGEEVLFVVALGWPCVEALGEAAEVGLFVRAVERVGGLIGIAVFSHHPVSGEPVGGELVAERSGDVFGEEVEVVADVEAGGALADAGVGGFEMREG